MLRGVFVADPGGKIERCLNILWQDQIRREKKERHARFVIGQQWDGKLRKSQGISISDAKVSWVGADSPAVAA